MSHCFRLIFLMLITTVIPAWASSSVAAERLVSTDSFISDLIFALKADDQLVAVDVTSHLPSGYRRLENIGYHRNLSAEGILKMRPTQVIGGESMGPASVVSALQAAGVQVTQLPMASTLQVLKNNIETVARRVAKPEQGAILIADLDRQVTSLQRRPLKQQRVGVLLSMDQSALRLAGAGTAGDAFIQLMGGINVARFRNFQTISGESLLSLRPDVLVIIGRDKSTAVARFLEHHSVARHTPAGRQQKILAVDGAALMTGLSPLAVREALALVQQIQPVSKPQVSGNH